jgi:hypothetical protein
MTEGDFEKLKDDTANPAHFHISYNHHFEPPSEKMSHKMNIDSGVPYVKELISRVLRRVEPAILSIALLRKRGAKSGIKESEDLASVLQWLHENEHHEEGVYAFDGSVVNVR